LRAFQEALAEDGVALSADEYYSRYLGYDDVGMFEALARDRELPAGGRSVTERVALKGTKLQRLLHSGEVLFPGAERFIREAAAAVPIAIASGALRHEIHDILDGADLRSQFTVIVASGDTPQSKPSPAPYRLAFERLRQVTGFDLDPRRCVAIEDSRWGLESARGAGVRCVGVTSSYGADELEAAELVVSGLDALTLDALDSLCRDHGM
jgi:HAD superfamily hydrolase (TIGR01509 family)